MSRGSHYTPRSLVEPIVRRTLEPLLLAMGEVTSEKLLALRICDPAMGAGIFLVVACQVLGGKVAAAWRREGKGKPGDLAKARRLVAERCLYGVDKYPLPVALAKLTLQMATVERGQPLAFVGPNLRCGDALVGVGGDLEDLKYFRWQPSGKPESETDRKLYELLSAEIERCLAKAAECRRMAMELDEGTNQPGGTA